MPLVLAMCSASTSLSTGTTLLPLLSLPPMIVCNEIVKLVLLRLKLTVEDNPMGRIFTECHRRKTKTLNGRVKKRSKKPVNIEALITFLALENNNLSGVLNHILPLSFSLCMIQTSFSCHSISTSSKESTTCSKILSFTEFAVRSVLILSFFVTST